MELQRHAMLMYTSCGWFFDEISGIESVQVVQYAARAIQLAQDLFGQDLEPGFLDVFQGAKSNIPENGDGRRIYDRFVKPAMIDGPKRLRITRSVRFFTNTIRGHASFPSKWRMKTGIW